MKSVHWLLALFILVPLIEIYALIQVGSLIGASTTIILVVSTALLGASLVRLQGLGALARIHAAMEQGQVPAVPLVEGAMLLVAGALLLTPGFFTDALGFLILVPNLRQQAARWLLVRFMREKVGTHPPAGARTIEGEYRRED